MIHFRILFKTYFENLINSLFINNLFMHLIFLKFLKLNLLLNKIICEYIWYK